jgi:uncharacterized protein YbjT (DUF2867 family)
MTTLVIGGTGTVGRQVVRTLLSRGENVRVLTRSLVRAGELPDGAQAAAGDLRDRASLAGVFNGVDGAFMATPVSEDESTLGRTAVEAAGAARLKRFVHMSVFRSREAGEIPHFRSKWPIEDALRGAGMPYAILQPNHFFQNDYWHQDPILGHGIYPEPLGTLGLSRVDVRDIADAAANALMRPGLEGTAYPLVGPDVLTGPGTAEIYSRLLGRPVRYGGDDLNAWEAEARKNMPGWMVRDLRIMYEYFRRHGLQATDADLALQDRVLGHPPRAFEAFAAETAAAWKSRAASHY